MRFSPIRVAALIGMTLSVTSAACSVMLAAQTSQPSQSLPNEKSAPYAGMGILVGEVTPQSALVQVRLTQTEALVDGDLPGASGVVEFVVSPEGDRDAKSTGSGMQNSQIIKATAERDFIARASFTGLASGTRYVCRTRIGANRNSLRDGPQAEFKTLAGADAAEAARFVIVTGMNYARFYGEDRLKRNQRAESDRTVGYPALATILSMQPDFFVGTGDNVYYDTPTDPRAKTIDAMRKKWHEQFAQRRYRDLFAAVPTYWEIDDHDYRRNDCDNTGKYAPSPELGKQVMLEQLPYAPADADNPQTYRTHRVNRDLQIWLTENRLHRSPNRTPDGPGKTIWGAEQKEWLKRTLRESDAKFKLLISPTPMVGPDDRTKTDNHTNIGGFQHERDEFFAWLRETGLLEQHFYVLCGDRHWQYHSIHPSGVEEFSCGALVDRNARLGRSPGDPKSTDPEGLIQQPYTQKRASGGFLMVSVTPANGQQPATLTFSHFDERGNLLNEHVKK